MNPHYLAAPLTTSVAEDLKIQYNDKRGIHIIYLIERDLHGKNEQASVGPFANFQMHYLVRYTGENGRYNILLGGTGGPGVELTLRDNYEIRLSEGAGDGWNVKVSNTSINKPHEKETTWYTLEFGSGNEIKCFINRQEIGKVEFEASRIKPLHWFHHTNFSSAKNLEIHLLSTDTAKLFQTRDWKDCTLYQLYTGSVVLITCKYKLRKYGCTGLCFKIGNVGGATAMVQFEKYTSTSKTYLLQVFIGEASYRVTSKDDTKLYESTSFYNTKNRTYFDFDWNIDLLDVRMELTVGDWSGS